MNPIKNIFFYFQSLQEGVEFKEELYQSYDLKM